MLVDLRTRQIPSIYELSTLVAAVAPPLNGNEIAIDLDGVGLLYPRIPIGRTGNDRVKRCFDVLACCSRSAVDARRCGSRAPGECTSRGRFYGSNVSAGTGATFTCTKLRTMAQGRRAPAQEVLSSNPILREEFLKHLQAPARPRITGLVASCAGPARRVAPALRRAARPHESGRTPPDRASETKYYGPYLPLVQTARPGLTGLWQVSGATTFRIRCA